MADSDQNFFKLDNQSKSIVNECSELSDCSNCCARFHPPLALNVNENEGEERRRDCEMLSSIYKLNSSSSASSLNTNTNTKSSFILCPACKQLLHELFSLFCKFNQIRSLESQLTREIQNVDKMLKQQENHNSNKNPKRLKHSSFSVADGPWVKIGQRLEEMEFEQIGYKPRRVDSNSNSPPRLNAPPQKQKETQVAETQSLPLNTMTKKEEEQTNFFKTGQTEASFSNSKGNDHLSHNEEHFVPEERKSEDEKSFSEPDQFHSDESESDLPLETPVKPKRKRERPNKNSEPTAISTATPNPKPRGRPKKRKLVQFQNPPCENSNSSCSENPEPTKPKKRHKSEDSPLTPQLGKFSPAELDEYYKSLGSTIAAEQLHQSQSQTPKHKYKCVAPGCFTTSEFKSIKALEKHERTVHKNDPRPFICNLEKADSKDVKDFTGGKVVCKFEAQSLEELRRHQNLRFHQLLKDTETRVTCLKCRVSLRSQLSYRYHFYRQHTEAGKQFYLELDKKIHEKAKAKRAQENAKGFLCQICNIDFLTKIKLTSHIKSEHPDYDSEFKPYACETCGKRFSGQYKLNDHVTKVHADSRPFVCDSCGKSYAHHKYLRDHLIRIHSDEGRLRFKSLIKESNDRRKIIQEALKIKQQLEEKEQHHESEQKRPKEETSSTADCRK